MENEKTTPNDAPNTEDTMIEKAKKQLNSMVLNDLEREYYEAQQKANLDHYSALDEMETKRKKIKTERKKLEKEKAQFEAEKIAIVRKLLQASFDNEFIANITGFSEEQIEKLRQEM